MDALINMLIVAVIFVVVIVVIATVVQIKATRHQHQTDYIVHRIKPYNH
jgi:hypothetical protein